MTDHFPFYNDIFDSGIGGPELVTDYPSGNGMALSSEVLPMDDEYEGVADYNGSGFEDITRMHAIVKRHNYRRSKQNLFHF